MPRILLANLALTLLLTGLIWTIQLVHYPLFPLVGATGLEAYVREHGRRIGVLVGPLMGLELLAGAALALRPPAGCPGWAAWAALALAGVVWGVTAVLFVPLHRRLGEAAQSRDLALLVRANWVRTAAWSARAGLLVWLAGRAS